MIYTELTKKALSISFNAHKDQIDKGGMPYVYHPFHLAEQMDDEYSTCVALLHDVIEDTGWTLNQIAAEGFPSDVLNALELMTHDSGVQYLDYVQKLSVNPIAKKVKMADLRHNSTRERLKNFTEKDVKRLKKYLNAQAILTGGTADLETMALRVSRPLTDMDGKQAVLEIIYEPDGRVRSFILKINAGEEKEEKAAKEDSEGSIQTTEEVSFQDRISLVKGLEKRNISAAQIRELFV